MKRRAAAKVRTTTIKLGRWTPGETWRVPRGFGAAYLRVLADHAQLIADGKPGKLIAEVIDLLALVGYEVTIAQVSDWDLRKRVEAVIYAATEHVRASDNPGPRHPKPSWLPDPWQGPPADMSKIRENLRGAFAGPRGTPIADDPTPSTSADHGLWLVMCPRCNRPKAPRSCAPENDAELKDYCTRSCPGYVEYPYPTAPPASMKQAPSNPITTKDPA